MKKVNHIFFEYFPRFPELRKVIFILLFPCLFFQNAQGTLPVFSGELFFCKNDEAIYFSYEGHQFQNGLLIFSYSVLYPGVTTLIMTDSDGEELWRNEYLDEKEGQQKIFLNKNKLESGKTYVFKFLFKMDRIMKAVTIP